MATEDWLPNFPEFEDLELEPTEFSCNRCGKPDLKWGTRKGKWVLEEMSGRKHICKRKDFLRKMFSDD